MNINRLFLLFLACVVAGIMYYRSTRQRVADSIYVGGAIYTADASFTVAQAMAVRNGRISDVGSSEEIRRKYRAQREIDLGGRTVFPGLIDAHAHLTSLGLARLTVDLVGSLSEREAAGRIAPRATAAAPGQWIRGRGWNQNLWAVTEFPHARSLDAIVSENPVILARIDGHAIWVNSKAMEIAGITAETPDPEGGRIVRDRSGRPTGVFVDNAKDLISQFIPAPSGDELREAMLLAERECLSVGLTGVHDMGADLEEIDTLKSLMTRDEFRLRIYSVVGGAGATWEAFRQSGPLTRFANDRLTVRSLKIYADGALGSRGAALIAPYDDDPGNRGLTVTSEEEMATLVRQALEAGFQVCTHAIGDRGNNITLNVYERELTRVPRSDRRLRVEHAQVLDPGDIPRFRTLGVIPSMQPTHCTSDMYWAEARLGPDRVKGAYAWRSLLRTGVIIPGGSDFPVEQPSPLEGMYAAVTRRDKKGVPANADDVRRTFQTSARGVVDDTNFENGWYSEQRMTFEEALRSFTVWAAYASFEEEIKGSLEPDKLADFVVLDRAIDPSKPEDLLQASVYQTYVGGRLSYEQNAR